MSTKPDATPAPERSLNRQLVLEEDEYTAALSEIIARDFFPSLVHLDATNGYLDAVTSKDPTLIQKSVRRLQELSDTPLVSTSRRANFESPLRTPWDRTGELSSGGRPSKRPKYDTDLSLDVFQAKYTSEDNSSFTQILDEENRVRKEKYGWAWDAQRRVEAQTNKMIEARERMLIEPAPATGVRQKLKIEAPTPAGLLTQGGERDFEESEGVKGKKRMVETEDEDSSAALVTTNSDEEAPVDVMRPKKDTRSAGVDGWKFKTRNSLMFAPDANESPYHQTLRPKEPEKAPKTIKYNNTRLPDQEESGAVSRSVSVPPSPTRSRIDAAITGTPYRPRSPKESGFSLVPNLPSPSAAELGPTALKQLMTWGTLNATPRVISSPEDDAQAITPATPFHLPRASHREVIAQQLSSKASKSLRVKAEMLGLRTPGIPLKRTPITTGFQGKRGDMAPPTWTPRKSDAPGNLTPAAKRLLQRTTTGTAGLRRADAMERNSFWDGAGKERELNRVRWTPTPTSGAR